jgi:UDP-N-acetylglucosamine transferase subunit ALG13
VIFLTVGTQLPFDRLVKAVDEWCGRQRDDFEVFAQVGRLGPENYRPTRFAFEERLSQDSFEERLKASKLIISHAGMGSIISALTYQKPILILPRIAKLGEHRNEHQLATAERFRARSGIAVADDEVALAARLDDFKATDWTGQAGTLSKYANQDLIDALRSFIVR